jgi:methylated-DNA-[protein]-cysteine S-methyltransferase
LYRHPIPVKLGSIVLTLNFRGLIQQIDWNWPRKAAPGASHEAEDAAESFVQNVSAVRSGSRRADLENQLSLVPIFVSSELTRTFEDYFSHGAPIGQVPWDLIDDSAWSLFQRQVYRAIAEIPHGETRTYGWVAARIGRGTAGRAVGQALRSNPLPILIPCHRVVASTSLGGFMGLVDPECSELRLKQRLISLEEEFLNPLFDFLTPSRELMGPIEPPAPSLLARESDLTPIRIAEAVELAEALA